MNALPMHHSSYQAYLDMRQEAEETGDYMLLALAYEACEVRFQTAWESVYRYCDGDSDRLCGVELHNERINQWAAILVDPTDPTMYRAQYFAANGFHGHACHRTAVDVLDELIREGFTQLDAGALVRLSSTQEWSYGAAVTSIIQKVSCGQISHSEADAAIERAKAQYMAA